MVTQKLLLISFSKHEDEIIFRKEAIKGFINCCDFNLNVLRLFFRCSFARDATRRYCARAIEEWEWAKDKGKSF